MCVCVCVCLSTCEQVLILHAYGPHVLVPTAHPAPTPQHQNDSRPTAPGSAMLLGTCIRLNPSHLFPPQTINEPQWSDSADGLVLTSTLRIGFWRDSNFARWANKNIARKVCACGRLCARLHVCTRCPRACACMQGPLRYMCVCVCVCVERERERERESLQGLITYMHACVKPTRGRGHGMYPSPSAPCPRPAHRRPNPPPANPPRPNPSHSDAGRQAFGGNKQEEAANKWAKHCLEEMSNLQ